MYPWLFEEVFGQEISSYLAMWVAAGVLSALYLILFYKKFGLDLRSAMTMFLYATIFGILGASVFSTLFRIGEVINGSKTILDLLLGSLMYYGGFLGGAIGLIIFSVKENKNFFKIADFAAVVLPLAHAVGRIGCYCAGCCFGVPSESHGVVFGTHALWGLDTAGVKVLPVMLYESLFNALLFAALMLVYYLIYRKNAKRSIGLLSGIYCVTYSTFRFIIEFFRYDVRGSIIGLSTAQFISVFVFLGGAYFLTRFVLMRRTSLNLTDLQKKLFLTDVKD